MIAADEDLAALETAHPVDDLIRMRTVADEITEAEDGVELLAPDSRENGAERLLVRVKVAEDQRSHRPLLSVSRRAFSRTLFGSSSTSRSTISEDVSSSRISRVMSDIL